jgi:hypothetical protein
MIINRIVFFAFSSVVLPGFANAQLTDVSATLSKYVNWLQLSPSTNPPGLSGYAMAYDALREEVVLFGGQAYGGAVAPALDDTWTWNGTTWTHLSPANSPPARYNAAMAYNTTAGQIILFGGWGCPGSGACGDTWIWNGKTWTEVSPVNSPSPRYLHSMTFYKQAHQVVLFGGQGTGQGGSCIVCGDTWIWNGSNWIQQFPSSGPSARIGASLADSKEGQVVLFGGVGTQYVNDTWVWDGSNWTEQFPASSPPPRAFAPMSEDLGDDIFLFGGIADDGNTQLRDSWVWQTNNWFETSSIDNPPAPTAYTNLTYDPKHLRVVYSAPPGQTWVWGIHFQIP